MAHQNNHILLAIKYKTLNLTLKKTVYTKHYIKNNSLHYETKKTKKQLENTA